MLFKIKLGKSVYVGWEKIERR